MKIVSHNYVKALAKYVSVEFSSLKLFIITVKNLKQYFPPEQILEKYLRLDLKQG